MLAMLLRSAVWSLQPSANGAIDAFGLLRRASVTSWFSDVTPAPLKAVHSVWLPAPTMAAPERFRPAAHPASAMWNTEALQEPSTEPRVAAANGSLGQWAANILLWEHAPCFQWGRAVTVAGSSAAQACRRVHVAQTMPRLLCAALRGATQAHTRTVSGQWASGRNTCQPSALAAVGTQTALPSSLAAARLHHLVSDADALHQRCFATRLASRPLPPPPPTLRGSGSGIDGVKHIVAVASGKGGVGKSTTAGPSFNQQHSQLCHRSTVYQPNPHSLTMQRVAMVFQYNKCIA